MQSPDRAHTPTLCSHPLVTTRDLLSANSSLACPRDPTAHPHAATSRYCQERILMLRHRWVCCWARRVLINSTTGLLFSTRFGACTRAGQRASVEHRCHTLVARTTCQTWEYTDNRVYTRAFARGLGVVTDHIIRCLRDTCARAQQELTSGRGQHIHALTRP